MADAKPTMKTKKKGNWSMNIKEELKHARNQVKQSCVILREKYKMENPEKYLRDTCGGSREGELAYAFYQEGRISALSQMAKR